MAAKKSITTQIKALIKSKRGAILALLAAVVGVETASPGTLAGLIGEQWASKVLGIFGILVAATKVVDTNKAE